MAIQMRRGLSKDFDAQKMRAGEWAVTIDADTQRQMVYMCFGAGVVKRMGTFDDLESELNPYKEAVQAYKESAEQSATNASLSERNAKQSEINAKASEVSAEESAKKAMSTTPEGYEQLVDDVGKIPLFSAQGTSLDLQTARGGVRVNKVVGKTIKSKNLLNPTLKGSATMNGVTCVEKDGAYTLNGTASDTCWFKVVNSAPLKIGTYKLVGCPAGGKPSSGWIFQLSFIDEYGGAIDYGDGALLTFPENTNKNLYIGVSKGTVCNNIVFKPMLTTDLSATIDDFMPYGLFSSGDMGSITIQEHGKNLIPFPYNSGNELVTNGVNFSVDTDGTLTAKRTSTATKLSAFYYTAQRASAVKSYMLEKGKYAVSGYNGVGSILVCCSNDDGSFLEIARLKSYEPMTFEIKDQHIGKQIDVRTEVSANELAIGESCTFKPMLVKVNDDGTYPTEYEPYRAKDVIIPLSEPLYEQNVLDVENQQIVKKYASMDLGSLNWTYSSDYSAWYVSVSGTKSSGMCYSDKYEYSSKSASQLDVGTVTISSVGRVYVKNGSSTEKPSGKLIYELATPTTEPLTPEQVKALHSLESYNGKTYIDTTDTYAKATFEVEYGGTDGVALAIQAKNDARLAYEEQKLIPRISVIDNYLSLSSTSALSAARGKDLNTRLLTLEQLLTMSEGQGTKTNNVSSGDCYWWRFGKVVVGQITCTVADVTVYYGNVALFSGLPAPNHSAICGGVEVDGDWTSSAYISVEVDGTLNLHMREETLAKRTIQANFVYILP